MSIGSLKVCGVSSARLRVMVVAVRSKVVL